MIDCTGTYKLVWALESWVQLAAVTAAINMAVKVGIVGFARARSDELTCSYGKVGKYLVSKLRSSPKYEVVFVWNRTSSAFTDADGWLQSRILQSLDDFATRSVTAAKSFIFCTVYLAVSESLQI